jgi:membrane dipeptidase
MISRLLFASALLISVQACHSVEKARDLSSLPPEEIHHIADSLAHAFVLVDTHVDLPYRLNHDKFVAEGDDLQIAVSTTEGDFDYMRSKKGGLDAPFMSIYIPSEYQQKSDMGKSLADSLINMVEGIAKALPDKFALARTPSDIAQNTAEGKISLPMGMENGAPIGNDPANVKYFYDRGVRYITLTHGKDNQICDSSYDSTSTWKGLSPFGEKVVAEMNRIGVMVDVSHISDSAFYDVMRIAKAPVIASHSSCRYFTPGFERNMSDDMIRLLGKNGGVIQISFGASFLDSVARKNAKLVDSIQAILVSKHLMSRDDAAKPVIEQFSKNPVELYSDVSRVADHIDHVVSLVGIDHVGFGSDFDGVEDSLPLGLKDVSAYPNLIAELLRRGYSDQDLEKICGGNLLRVWNKVIEQSRRM